MARGKVAPATEVATGPRVIGRDVAVIIQRGHVVYQDDVSYEQGQVVEVTEPEAKQLATSGAAKRQKVGR